MVGRHHRDDQRDGELGQLGKVLGQESLEAPERAGDPGLLAGLERAGAVGAGADALDQEVEADAAGEVPGPPPPQASTGAEEAAVVLAAPCISWMLRTSASPWRPAAIARAAAVAPVIVVTQGMPWRTAAVRIS